MQRQLDQLSQTQFDVLVVGGGIHGACVARDAALRGLRVALIERGDFGSATSSNSLKTLHGGLRYLQDGNLLLAHRMILERKAWLRTAPQWVRPLPFLLPVVPRSLTRNQAALAFALKLSDLIGAQRNQGITETHHLPPSRIVNSAALRDWDIPVNGAAALWYDAQMLNSERLLLSVVMSAQRHGAVVANYVEMSDMLGTPAAVAGVQARDVLSQRSLQIRAHITVNCSGHRIARANESLFRPSLAINLVTRQLLADYAVGVTGPGGQTFFIIPWQDHSLIGTLHLPAARINENPCPVTLPTVQHFLAEINQAYPDARLRLDDVRRLHWGYLPTADGHTKLLREGRVYDHATSEGVDGLLTVVGVKFTSARMIAESAVNLIYRKLDQTAPACQTATTALAPEEFSLMQVDSLKLLQSDTTLGQIIQHAVDCEMACHLDDVLLRRTPLAAAARPQQDLVRRCAELMATALGWDLTQTQREMQRFDEAYPDLRRIE